jgi:sarcosine oxidase subunit alpha
VETRDGRRRSIGFVTSSYRSPTLGRPIALGLIERGLSRMGEELEFVHLGKSMRAVISPVCAFDPRGERLNA